MSVPILKKSHSYHSGLKVETEEEVEQPTIVQNPLFKPRAILVDLLLAPDFELMNALGEVVLVTEEGQSFAKATIDFYSAHNKLDKLMEWAISKEINLATTTSTLFRGACEATKLMPTLYARLGTEYLRQLVGPLVKDITSSSQSFEIDPNKAERGVDPKDNLKKVLSITSELLRNIYDSTERCPSFLRYIFWYAKKEVTKKFPQASSIIVGVFFFLRFMIPAIVTPTSYGLLLDEPVPQAQRGLILISKLLQNLSNGIEFDSFDEYYQEMNKFIVTRMASLYSFFDRLADKKGTIEPPFTIIPEIEGGALLIITAAVKEHREALYNLLTKAETKKTFLKVADGSYDTPNLFTSNTLGRQSFKRNKLEKLHQKLQSEVKMEKVTKLEELLEEEIKQRKVLEKKYAKIGRIFPCENG